MHRSLPIAGLIGLALVPRLAIAQVPAAASASRSLGLGGGITLPAGGLFDTASIRVRLDRNFILETLVEMSTRTETSEVESEDASTTLDTTASTLNMALSMRTLLAQQDTLELQLITGLGLSRQATEIDPEGTRNSTVETIQQMSIQAGLGIEHFINPHWAVSVDAITPVLTRYSAVLENQATQEETTTQGQGFGLEPSIRMQLHLYY